MKRMKCMAAVRYFGSDMLLATYRFVPVIFLVWLLVGCDKNEAGGEPPQINFMCGSEYTCADTTIAPGKLLQFALELQAGDDPITQLILKVHGDSVQTYYDSGMYVQETFWKGSFAKSFQDNETWEFIVRDRFSRSSSLSLFIRNDTITGFGPVESQDNVILGAQSSLQAGGFYCLKEQAVYVIDAAFEAQELIDLVYYFSQEDAHTLASPGANIETGIFNPAYEPVSWDHRNTTRFIKTSITQQAFETIENDSLLLVSYVEGEGKRKAKQLEPDDVYSFKTQDSKFGLLRVKAVTGAEAGTITIDVKIQP